ncbi:GTPase-activating protein skywalker isoform X2 [Oratosquilla oratoria]|uniref:GTPase-activating protein skywalker isoform X2 n=1 Tax=Oratosquilla oratoria TaxID=337810 RepID=UPI003F760F12
MVMFASRGLAAAPQHNGCAPHHAHRPRLNSKNATSVATAVTSTRRRQHHSSSAEQEPQRQRRRQHRQEYEAVTVRRCDSLDGDDFEIIEAPEEGDTFLSPFEDDIGSCYLTPSLDSLDDLDYGIDNNNDSTSLDLNRINNKYLSRPKSVGYPVEAFPESLIQWPVDGSTKSRRIAQVKKQVKLLGHYIKMTVGNEDGRDDKSPANPAPFSSLVEMARIPALTHGGSEDVDAGPTWQDLQQFLQANRMKEAKVMVRWSDWGLGADIRVDLWREICRHHSSDKDFSDLYYWDTVKQIFGTTDLSQCSATLPAFVDSSQQVSAALSPKGVSSCERVMAVLGYSHPAITYAPALYAITALLLHYMDEPDAYNCVSSLANSSQNKFVTQTKVAHESMWRTALALARKHVRGSFSTLSKFGVTPEQLEEAFQQWLWWILAYLPLTHVVRVMDCFLLEGSKVFLRVALAIFHVFVKAVTRDSSLASSLPSRGLSESISRFCQNMQLPPSKLLRTAFGIRGFSKSEIRKVLLQTEMLIKSQKSAATSGPGMTGGRPDSGLLRSVSLEGLPTSQSQAEIQMMSHTLTIKDGCRSPVPRAKAMGHYLINKINSMVVVKDELLTVWGWLPMRMTMHQPVLVYTTEEHGCSLTTFYQRVEKHEPILLLVRTTNDHVFGCYCSTALEQRNIKDEFGNRQTYFGTGETFLFSLRPNVAKYQWVGITRQQQGAAVSGVEHSAELFIHADNNMITIGGGKGQALMLDQELRFGKTEMCQTFDNPPLCPDTDFEVKVVEVYSLSHA